jgi:hypothetical protein
LFICWYSGTETDNGGGVSGAGAGNGLAQYSGVVAEQIGAVNKGDVSGIETGVGGGSGPGGIGDVSQVAFI